MTERATGADGSGYRPDHPVAWPGAKLCVRSRQQIGARRVSSLAIAIGLALVRPSAATVLAFVCERGWSLASFGS